MITMIHDFVNLDTILAQENIAVFGAGYASRNLLKYAAKNKFYVRDIYVSDVEENPLFFMGIKVNCLYTTSREELTNTVLVVALTEKNHAGVYEIISSMPFKNVFYLCDDMIKKIAFFNEGSESVMSNVNEKVRECVEGCMFRYHRFIQKPCLEYMIVNILDHCNLRCKGCDHFACIADEKFFSRDSIYKDLERMAELFDGDYIIKISVMGGEPLLHPELLQILQDVRHFFPYTTIRLTTNGVLLLQQKEDFWRICRENKVTIVNTKYPINLNFEEIKRRAYTEGVVFRYFEGTGDDVVKQSFKKIINLEGDSNPVESFSKCHISNYGNILLEGKFYGCPFSVQSYRIFNKKFNQNLRMTEEDYLDIYKVNSKEEFFEFAARPKFYCRYCSGLSEPFEWERSKFQMSEWV